MIVAGCDFVMLQVRWQFTVDDPDGYVLTVHDGG